jgi:4-diphosphocytidyl-2-C-methyl-D-erythritol kinase
MAAIARGFVLKARAKFNLRLEVGALTSSGRHSVRSVVGDLLACDDVAFLPSDCGFEVSSDGLSIAQTDNLVWRAAHALGIELPNIRIHVTKGLPIQAGLGGGSADAAAALRGIAMTLAGSGFTVPPEALWAAAASVGSDVPSCLIAGFKVVEGTGEIARALPLSAPPWGVLLLKPEIGVPTRDAYRLLDGSRESHGSTRSPRSDSIAALCDALAAYDFSRVCALVHNDFQSEIELAYPLVAHARQRVAATGAAATILCGSGACVAGLFENASEAKEALALIQTGPGEWTSATGFADGD